MRLIDLQANKKDHEDHARYWRAMCQRTKEGTRERECRFLFDCINTNLARIAELRIQSAVAAVTLGILLSVALPLAAHGAPPQKAPRHVTHAISTITVKVVSVQDFERKAAELKALAPNASRLGYAITASDADSCTAWVNTRASATVGMAAYKACRSAIDSAVDAAHAAAENTAGAGVGVSATAGLPLCTSEDASTGPSPCRWDCRLLGNRQCGAGPRVRVIRKDA